MSGDVLNGAAKMLGCSDRGLKLGANEFTALFKVAISGRFGGKFCDVCEK